MNVGTLDLDDFDRRWSGLLRERRRMRSKPALGVSRALGIEIETVELSERQPSRVPLCDLALLVEFYEIGAEQSFELCMSPFRLTRR